MTKTRFQENRRPPHVEISFFFEIKKLLENVGDIFMLDKRE